MATRIRWALSLLFLAVAPAGVLAVAQEGTPSSHTEARIEFYKGRLGGRGTYPAYARLGVAYAQKARESGRLSYYDDAERYLLRSLSFQRNYEALRGLAVVYLARHQFREALAYAKEAVETLPEDPGAQGTLFDIYLVLGDSEKAAAVVDTMLSLRASFISYARLASLRHYQGDLMRAVEAMERACADAEAEQLPAETLSWCQVRLGYFYACRCEADKAEEAYRGALERFTDYYLALEHLAELRAAQGRQAEAIELYSKLLESNPDPHYRVALAELYDTGGQGQQAAQERQRALAEFRRSVESGSRAYVRALAVLLLDQEQNAAEGLRWASTDWETRRDAYAADTLAWAYFQNGLYSEARQAMEEALRSDLKEAGVLLHAAEIHFRLGQDAQARAFLKQVLACPLTLRPPDRVHAEKLRADLQSSPQP